MNKLYKAWLVLKIVLLTITLLLYGNLVVGIFMFLITPQDRLDFKWSDIYSPEIKLALIVFTVMCTIEAVILLQERRKDEVLFELYDYYKDDIDISDYSPGSVNGAFTYDYEKEEPKLIEKALSDKYFKLTLACAFLITGLELTVVTGSQIDIGLTSVWYRSFVLFKIFFYILTTFMILDYGFKILRIKRILKKRNAKP